MPHVVAGMVPDWYSMQEGLQKIRCCIDYICLWQGIACFQLGDKVQGLMWPTLNVWES